MDRVDEPLFVVEIEMEGCEGKKKVRGGGFTETLSQGFGNTRVEKGEERSDGKGRLQAESSVSCPITLREVKSSAEVVREV